MRIGINIRSFTNRGGIGQYTRSLLKNLLVLFPNDRFILFGIKNTNLDSLQNSSNWEFHEIHGPSNRLFWERFALVAAVNLEKLDIFHNPDYTVPTGLNCSSVVTVHDLSFKYYPHGLSWKARILYNLTARRSVERSKLIIADSHYTKHEIVRAGWKNAIDIRVVHLGVDETFFEDIPDELINSTLEQYDLVRGYILYVGAIDKRKNVISIVQAYASLKNAGIDMPKLVIAGEDIGGGAEITREVLKHGIGNDVLRLGFISRENIRQIYRGARMFVFPSFYEGFGLPPLEAMASGVPVITSESSSLPEVVGDAGFMVPAGHIEPLAEAMRIFVADAAIHEQYSKKGRERARKFTWAKVAKETMAIYREAMNKSNNH